MNLQNPSKINKPKLNSPIGKSRNEKGNLPYLRARRRMRRELFRY